MLAVELGSREFPGSRGFVAEPTHVGPSVEMSLDVKRVVDGSVGGEKPLSRLFET